MTHYFITGYSDGSAFTGVRVAPAPVDPVERSRGYDALLYGPEGQDGLLAFTVEADGEDAALREGRKAHAAWLSGNHPDIR